MFFCVISAKASAVHILPKHDDSRACQCQDPGLFRLHDDEHEMDRADPDVFIPGPDHTSPRTSLEIYFPSLVLGRTSPSLGAMATIFHIHKIIAFLGSTEVRQPLLLGFLTPSRTRYTIATSVGVSELVHFPSCSGLGR